MELLTNAATIKERALICKNCENLLPVIHVCKECKCFMPAKMTLIHANCPLQKW